MAGRKSTLQATGNLRPNANSQRLELRRSQSSPSPFGRYSVLFVLVICPINFGSNMLLVRSLRSLGSAREVQYFLPHRLRCLSSQPDALGFSSPGNTGKVTLRIIQLGFLYVIRAVSAFLQGIVKK